MKATPSTNSAGRALSERQAAKNQPIAIGAAQRGFENLLVLVQKNLKLLVRARASALIVILGPLLVIFLAGLAFDNTNLYAVRIGTYSPSYNDLSNSFIEKLWAVRRIGEIIDELDLKGRNEELVKELVGLSTKHGILTPYTSFLADESTDRYNLAANTATARGALEALSQTSGESGVAQRAAKGVLQNAANPSLVPADRYARGLLGQSTNFYFDAKKDKQVAVDTVQNVGSKTFYRRGDRWIDGSLSQEQEKSAVKIERFSADYFKLIDKHGKDVARYLSFDDPVTIELGGQAYSF